MSDPRFARLKTDPRFRRVRKKDSKVVVDDRFKSVFGEDKNKKGKKAAKGRVDKYGRPLAATHEGDNLRRFYRLQDDDVEEPDVAKLDVPDYARGGVLLESSDEEDDNANPGDDESDAEGVVTLGRDSSKPIPVSDDLEVDPNEGDFADLDAQAAAYANSHPHDSESGSGVGHTRRIAVVNLDWDHVRATHLYKIFSSLVSPTPSVSGKSTKKNSDAKVVKGRVLSVRVYPSEFGKERMAREEKEGPPAEVFKKPTAVDENDPRSLYETGDGEDYDEDALRKYQLERLRYYYAIVECDTVEAASHIFSELEGTELERSANVFDLSFVPDAMSFDDECRDEASEDLNVPYKGLEFVTDALRHSKVKLTWDEDDPERNQITRRTFTRKEIEENDFRAYIASGSESDEEDGTSKTSKGKASRDKLRELLLGGNDEALPEGWGDGEDDEGDVDMEVTFTPGLSAAKEDRDETTLEKYQRKAKEKKKLRKEERTTKAVEPREEVEVDEPEDDFFGADSEDERENGSEDDKTSKVESKLKRSNKKAKVPTSASQSESRRVSTAEELALVAASDKPSHDPKHFDMKAVLKAEKSKGRKKRDRKKGKAVGGEDELQEDFAINLKDHRFKAVHEDSTFAIDPSNPHFKKTKGMSALLEEGSKRRRERYETSEISGEVQSNKGPSEDQLHKLVESVKRKSISAEKPSIGKRRKL